MKLNFGILGPLEARRDGTPVELGPPKQKAVLAVLLISVNQVVSLDRLIEMLWGEDVPARAHGTLQAYIHNLRKVLEPDRAVRSQAQVLVTRPPGYVVQVEPDAFDASRFEILAGHGHRLLAKSDPASAKEHLMEALALWRGPALAEFAFEHFAQSETARLEEVRAIVNEDLLDAELALGNHARVVGDITVAVGEHPLRERLWGLLMLALYRSGRQGEALRAFAMARHTLAEELGIDPSPALRALEADILAQSPDLEYYRHEAAAEPLSPSAATSIATAQVVARAPRRPPLVGRQNQLQSVVAAMAHAQVGYGGIVLISGEAGIGKTRLAEEVATEAQRNGSPVAWGWGYEQEGAPPYWPWMQVAKDLLRQSDPDRITDALVGRAAVLRPLLPDSAPGVPATAGDPPDTAVSRFALFEAMTRFLVKLAEPGLLVVVLEDLQWADRRSLQLLEHLAVRIPGSHVLVVATCQPPENFRQSPLAEAVGGLARLPGFGWVELDGLSTPEVARLIAQTGARITPAQVSEIHSRTDGNPFFVSDFARLLATRDLPFPFQPGLVPNSIRAVIRRELSRLPDQTQNLLLVAAAMGRDFDIPTVAAAIRATVDDAVNWVHFAVLAGVVVEDAMSIGTYRFSRGLVRETLRGDLDGLRRNALIAFSQRVVGERETSNADESDQQQEAYG